MKLLIDNSGYALKNYGDLAMLLVNARQFKEHFPAAEISIFTEAPEKLKDLLPFALPVSPSGRNVWLMPWNLFGALHKFVPSILHPWLLRKERLIKLMYPNASKRWVKRRLSKRGVNIVPMVEYLDAVEQADVVIGSGGGFITDSFEYHACSLLQTIALAQFYGKPTALFGQGLGPVKSKEIQSWVSCVFPKLNQLSLREGLFSKPFASISGINPSALCVTGDDAIRLANSMAPQKIGSNLGVNLRLATYSGVGESAVSAFKKILTKAAVDLDTALCGLPISFHEGDSDLSSLRGVLGDDAVDISVFDSIDKLVKQVGGCRVVITGSYHAGVFALSQGVSVIAVVGSDYYRQKFEGLAEQFTLGCQIVDQGSSLFEENLKLAIANSWSNADDARPALLRKAEEQISLSEQAYSKFFETFNDGE